MDSIKKMLLGIAILLLTIIIHLFLNEGYITDFISIIGVILGGLNFSVLSIKFGDAIIKYGLFIQSIVDFLIVAFCIFMMVKLFEKFKKKEDSPKKNGNKKSDEVFE